MGNLPTLYHIYKRPYVEEFLSIVYQWFDLICFTASIKEYADPVIDYLEEQVLMNDIMKKYIKNSKLNQPMKIFKKGIIEILVFSWKVKVMLKIYQFY